MNFFLPGAAGKELLPWSAVRKAGYFVYFILAEKQNSTLMRTQKKEYQMALDKMEAELHSLQLQIHPHFLCNLLESIRSLNELGNHFEANAMIRELGDFFRYSISHKTPIVFLREEIAFTRAYCNILRHKYRNGIHCIWNCDPAELGTPVLRLPMQFLIENAVCHGLPLVVVKVLCVFRACSKQNFFY